MKSIAVIIAVVGSLLLGGCASSLSGRGYSREQARSVQTVRMGVVESVREVQIEGTKTPVGPVAGAVIGGVGGSAIGGGRGSAIAAVLGAVGGGLLGGAAEEGVTRRAGLEITVKLDDGNLLAITQEADEAFQLGERVRVLFGNSGVTPGGALRAKVS